MAEKKEQPKPRRDYGDGSIYRRESDGRWVGSFRHDGKRKYVYGETRPEAKKKLEEAKQKAEQGTLVASSKQKLSEYLDYWLATTSKSVEPSTQQNRRYLLQRVRKALGNIQLQKLTRAHVQHFMNDLDDKLEASTIHRIHEAFSMALDAAVEWKYLSENPCKHVVLPKVEQNERTILTPEQAKHLLNFVHSKPLEPFVVLALGTAMRKGEICALRWSDIDFESNLIKVDHKVYYLVQDGHHQMVEGKPKSKASKRLIPMAAFVKEVLLRHRKKQREQRVRAVEWQDKNLIFCGKNGDFYADTTLYRHFDELLQEAGLPDIPVHRLRHTCNTLLRLMGVDAVTRQKIMGHSRLDETEGTYGHTYDEMKLDAMDRLDRLFSDDNDTNSLAN